MRQNCHNARMRSARRGFSIVELLITLAIIVILLSIVLVALDRASRRAQEANTSFLMGSITQGLARFKDDHGYLPPVLDSARGLDGFGWTDDQGRPRTPVPPSDPGEVDAYADELQEWYSVTSIAEYLLGYGDATETGYDGLGIRSPGPDGYWNVGAQLPSCVTSDLGTLQARRNFLGEAVCNNVSERYRSGRVYNSYIDLRDDRILASIAPNDPGQVLFPGDEGFDDPDRPRVIVDYWGEPIRYYRRPHPIATPDQPYQRRDDGDLVYGTLADVFVLRPFQLPSSEDGLLPALADAAGSARTTMELRTAEFAIFSSGPNRMANNEYRYDHPDYGAATDEANRDNIVELGR